MSANSQAIPLETLIDSLIVDPDRFEKAEYAEMGVPMFLIGEDPALPATFDSATLEAGAVDSGAVDPLAQHFAALARALATRKPMLDGDDVAILLELLARRDFQPHGLPELVTDDFSLPAQAPQVLRELAEGMAQSRAIRLVNFHATPRYREAEYREQIAALARDFEPITPANFADAFGGTWNHARPGVMPALFEGYRDNLDVVLPILEEFGFTAWFFIPSGFLNVPPLEQRKYAACHTLHLPLIDEYPGERIALTWDEARDIVRRGHTFACHTRTHNLVTPDTPHAVLEDEIAASKAEMERELGVAVEIFCWLEGAALGINAQADAMLRQSGYRYLLSNFKLQKLQ
ncbi:polysaccharide deacetylase family protein [Novosphingobium sp.]|uniref:polysaccharide deacetylase family protein n=1 Tax=Novosphingobium sp. TaxID=1874826 RepID=UPI003D0DEE74